MTPSSESSSLARELAQQGISDFDVAVILGSGLGAFADEIEDPVKLPFDRVEAMPASAVPGHAGRWVVGRLGEARVLVQQGRVHLYEGWSAEAVARSVRAYAGLGCGALVITNAAGGLDADRPVPGLMRIKDHIHLQGATPLAPAEAGRGLLYDKKLGALVDEIAKERGIALDRGVYAALTGPAYETPAEIRMLTRLAAHAVGMSTACEVLAAVASGMRVVGLSCISNYAAGISPGPLDHAEVVAAGRAIEGSFRELLSAILPAIAQACDRLEPGVGCGP